MGFVIPSEAKTEDAVLKSKQYAAVIDAISEGEIAGLVSGLKSVYLNGTPIESADGTKNFKSLSDPVFSNGPETPDPAFHLKENSTSSVVNVGVEITKATPVVRRIVNDNLSWVEIVIGLQGLSKQNDDGSLAGTSVELKVEASKDGGATYELIDQIIIKGKSSSRYQKSYRIDATGYAGNMDIRVSRITDDSTDLKIQNKTAWDYYIEGVDVKLSYPNTAISQLSFDSEQFNQIPTRAYDVKGIKVLVPNNYNPETREYTGIWTGIFAEEKKWTNNPAWVLYDLCTSPYGLGDFLTLENLNIWALYEIAKYCDELVPDGFGGMEPRFSCNIAINTRNDAFKVVGSLMSVFRGLPFWADNKIQPVADMPRVKSAIFTPANVISGVFNYEGSDRRARHTVALVTWLDPLDQYKPKIEYVQDDEAVRKYGLIETEIVATGCTSRGQAHRIGKWLLYTEQEETETVTFSAGLDAARIAPGSIIVTHDPVRSGIRLGGRIRAHTTNSITIDSEVTLDAGKAYTATVVLVSGALQTVPLNNAPGTTTILASSQAFTEELSPNAIWVLSTTDANPEYWRVVNIAENDDSSSVKITAMSYNESKYDYVERNLKLQHLPVNTRKMRPDTPAGLTAKTEIFRLNNAAFSSRISVSWASQMDVADYIVVWQYQSDNEVTRTSKIPHFDIENTPPGTYRIRVCAKNAADISSEWVEITHTVTPYQTGVVVPTVTGLTLDPDFNSDDLPLRWDRMLGASFYQVQLFSKDRSVLYRSEATPDNRFVYTLIKNIEDGGPRREVSAAVRTRTVLGDYSDWTYIDAKNQPPAVPVGMFVFPGPKSGTLSFNKADDQDWAGVLVWLSTDPICPAVDSNLVYDGPPSNSIHLTKNSSGQSLSAGTRYYVRVAAYDVFGRDEVNISSSIAFETQYTVAEQLSAALSKSIEDEATAKVEAEAQARIAALTAEANTRAAALLAEAASRDSGDTTERIQRIAADSTLTQRVDTLSSTVAGNDTRQTAALQTVQSTLAAADSAEATARQTLATQMQGADNALQSSITNLANTVTTNQSTTATRLDTLQSSIGSDSLVPDRALADPAQWRSHYGYSLTPFFVAAPDGPIYKTAVQSIAGGGAFWNYSRTKVRIEPGRTYRFSMRVKRQGTGNSGAFVWWRSILGGYSYMFLNNSELPVDTWATVTRDYTAANFGDSMIEPGFALNHANGMGDGSIWQMQDFRFWDVTDTLGVNDAKASISTLQQTVATNQTSTASQISTIQTTLNGQSASITTQQTSINGLSADYQLKLDAGGRVASIRSRANGERSEIILAAEIVKFQGAGSTAVPMFATYTQDTVVNGVTVKAGTYINGLTVDRIRAQQIDTSGLVIRGPDGRPIFASGDVTASVISGLGSFATQNTADWASQVTGTGKPENNATRNVYTGKWALGKTYQRGDIVIDAGDGYAWSATALIHVASESNKPPVYPLESNEFWTIYALKGDDGFVGTLTNESASVSATHDGTIDPSALNTFATGRFVVYKGQKEVAASNVLFVLTQQVGCTGTIDAQGQYRMTSLSADTGSMEMKATYLGATVTKVFSVTKSKGATPAVTYDLILSDKVVTKNADGTITPGKITATAQVRNGTADPVPYSGKYAVDISTDGTNFSSSYVSSGVEVSTDYIIGPLTKAIRFKLHDGAKAVSPTSLLDEESVAVLASAIDYDVEITSTNGTIFRVGQARQTTLIAKVYRNAVEITNQIPESSFCWKRTSSDDAGDRIWNTAHQQGYRQVVISVDDVNSRATFICEIQNI